MNHRGFRAASFAGAALALALVGAACSSAVQPTPIYVVQTPTPVATPVATPAPATPTPEATPLATFTPWPTGTPTPSAGPTATHTAAPTPTTSAGPTSPAAFCTGNANNQAFFLQAAKGVKFTVYCATKLPAGWVIASGNWNGGSNNQVVVTYKYKTTSETFQLKEGAFCTTSPLACISGPLTVAQSGVSFDGMSGSLDNYGTNSFLLDVASGTTHAYFMITNNVPQATAVTFAANMKAVPKI